MERVAFGEGLDRAGRDVHRCDAGVPPFRNRCDVARPLRIVTERVANLLEAGVDAMFEIDEGLSALELLSKLFARDETTRTADEQGENLKGLRR